MGKFVPLSPKRKGKKAAYELKQVNVFVTTVSQKEARTGNT